jgi:hypothetical protein
VERSSISLGFAKFGAQVHNFFTRKESDSTVDQAAISAGRPGNLGALREENAG